MELSKQHSVNLLQMNDNIAVHLYTRFMNNSIYDMHINEKLTAHALLHACLSIEDCSCMHVFTVNQGTTFIIIIVHNVLLPM